MEGYDIIAKTTYGIKNFTGTEKRIAIPYIIFGFLFFTMWGDLNDIEYREYRLFGFNLSSKKVK